MESPTKKNLNCELIGTLINFGSELLLLTLRTTTTTTKPLLLPVINTTTNLSLPPVINNGLFQRLCKELHSGGVCALTSHKQGLLKSRGGKEPMPRRRCKNKTGQVTFFWPMRKGSTKGGVAFSEASLKVTARHYHYNLANNNSGFVSLTRLHVSHCYL